MLDFLCFDLYLETYDLHHFLNRFVIFNKLLGVVGLFLFRKI